MTTSKYHAALRKINACALTTITSLTFLLAGCTGLGTDNSSQPPKLHSNLFAGCFAPGATTGTTGCGLLNSFGDPNADAAFGSEVNFQETFWQGLPTNVHVWNDCQNPNAVSLPSHDILYGIRLFQMLATSFPGNGLPIAGVLAHEWGHQAQFAFGWMQNTEPTARPTELEADALSGYYMALAKSFAWPLISDYFAAVANMGDFNFNDPSHHGTPLERLAAARLGFDTGIRVLQTQVPLSYPQLHQIFSAAIASFPASTLQFDAVSDATSLDFLNALRASEFFDILKGYTRGSDLPIPVVRNKAKLFPRILSVQHFTVKRGRAREASH
ncbi:MAG: hypothetical protein ACJ71U_15545 [Terriglobales bacterium]